MKPQLRDKIAIYQPAEPINAQSGKKIEEAIRSSITTLKSLDLKAVLFSLEKVEEIDESGRATLISTLKNMQNVLEVDVGIIDYPDNWFIELKRTIGSSSVALFKNFEVAFLLLNAKKHHRFDKVVLFDENEMLRELMVSELRSKGYKVEVVSSRNDFASKSKSNEYGTLYISDTHMDLINSFIPTKIKNGVVIYQLHDVLDKKIETHFSFNAHNIRIQDGFKLFVFDASEVKTVNPRVFEFFISLSLLSLKHGVKLVIAEMNKKFLNQIIVEKLQKSGIAVVDTMEYIWNNQELKKLQKAPDKSKGLTKKLVAALPIFIDAALETFESLTGSKAVKKSHQISTCSIALTDKIVSSALAFEGELNGSLVLVFSEPIARKAAEMLLGDDNCSFEELLDAISEFANIIGGKSKALLAEREQHITIAIPKTFDSKEKLGLFLGTKNGVQIELQIDNDPIVLFLTY